MYKNTANLVQYKNTGTDGPTVMAYSTNIPVLYRLPPEEVPVHTSAGTYRLPPEEVRGGHLSMSDANAIAIWPPKYASPTSNSAQMRYTRIQGLAFVVSCVSMTAFLLGLGPFANATNDQGVKGRDGTMLALYVEVFLLVWRWVNELAHGECDLSGWLHHGALLLAIVLIELNAQVLAYVSARKLLSHDPELEEQTYMAVFDCRAIPASDRV